MYDVICQKLETLWINHWKCKKNTKWSNISKRHFKNNTDTFFHHWNTVFLNRQKDIGNRRVVLQHLFIWKASEPKKTCGEFCKENSLKKSLHFFTFFKSPWVNNEQSKAKENVNKCHSKKAIQRAKIRKKCNIKVWTLFFWGKNWCQWKENPVDW